MSQLQRVTKDQAVKLKKLIKLFRKCIGCGYDTSECVCKNGPRW